MQPATFLEHSARVERLVAALKRDLGRPISLGEMAEIAALSPFHLTRVVRELTSLPPVALHGALRIQEAKRLLLTTDASVTDACFAVGFSSLGSFSSRFAADVGASPSDYKRSPTFVDGHADQLSTMVAAKPDFAPPWGIHGEIVCDGPVPDDGLIFVGLFPTAHARGYPIGGDVLRRPGRFSILHAPDGAYTVLVAFVPQARSSVDWVMPDNEPLVGTSGRIRVSGGVATRDIVIRLRGRSPIESPVLLSPMAAPHVVAMMRSKLDRLTLALP